MNSLPFLLAAGITPVGVVFTVVLAVLIFVMFYIMLSPLPKEAEPTAEEAAVAKFADIPREPRKETSSQFYLLQDGQPSGPYSANEIRNMHKAGKLHADTMLARGGETAWMDLQEWMRSITKPVPSVPAAGTFLPSADQPKTVGAGLVQAGLIIGGLGLLTSALGAKMLGPLGATFGFSAMGLGLVLIIIGACIK